MKIDIRCLFGHLGLLVPRWTYLGLGYVRTKVLGYGIRSGIGIDDWGLGLGLGIGIEERDWDWGLGFGIGNWRLGLGIGIGDGDWALRIGDWGL